MIEEKNYDNNKPYNQNGKYHSKVLVKFIYF